MKFYISLKKFNFKHFVLNTQKQITKFLQIHKSEISQHWFYERSEPKNHYYPTTDQSQTIATVQKHIMHQKICNIMWSIDFVVYRCALMNPLATTNCRHANGGYVCIQNWNIDSVLGRNYRIESIHKANRRNNYPPLCVNFSFLYIEMYMENRKDVFERFSTFSGPLRN